MIETIVGIGVPVIASCVGAGLVWASRTHARLSVIEERLASLDEWLDKVERKLDRIIERL